MMMRRRMVMMMVMMLIMMMVMVMMMMMMTMSIDRINRIFASPLVVLLSPRVQAVVSVCCSWNCQERLV